ncbi:hypothetical protein VNO78_01619 [Psophocarpus tetragonolobus]|uniref:Uncharacterized protein n=1 Tax=Psophocarpus tetragonolobus TaxID=3891 RepID=A0AAN9XUS1_PSOTE
MVHVHKRGAALKEKWNVFPDSVTVQFRNFHLSRFMRELFGGCSFNGGSAIVMLRIKECFLVLVLFGVWLVFGKTQHHVLLLDHREDFGLELWVEVLLSALSVVNVPSLSQALV